MGSIFLIFPGDSESLIHVLMEKRRINVTFCKCLLEYNELRDWCLFQDLRVMNG